MENEDYKAACKREIEAAENVCGKDAPQAQLVGHLAGEVVRLRAALTAYVNADDWTREIEDQAIAALAKHYPGSSEAHADRSALS